MVEVETEDLEEAMGRRGFWRRDQGRKEEGMEERLFLVRRKRV